MRLLAFGCGEGGNRMFGWLRDLTDEERKTMIGCLGG